MAASRCSSSYDGLRLKRSRRRRISSGSFHPFVGQHPEYFLAYISYVDLFPSSAFGNSDRFEEAHDMEYRRKAKTGTYGTYPCVSSTRPAQDRHRLLSKVDSTAVSVQFGPLQLVLAQLGSVPDPGCRRTQVDLVVLLSCLAWIRVLRSLSFELSRSTLSGFWRKAEPDLTLIKVSCFVVEGMIKERVAVNRPHESSWTSWLWRTVNH